VSVRYFRHVGRISGTPYLGPDAHDARQFVETGRVEHGKDVGRE